MQTLHAYGDLLSTNIISSPGSNATDHEIDCTCWIVASADLAVDEQHLFASMYRVSGSILSASLSRFSRHLLYAVCVSLRRQAYFAFQFLLQSHLVMHNESYYHRILTRPTHNIYVMFR